jgi:hypothetical protein
MLDSSLWRVYWQGSFHVAIQENIYTPIPPVDIPIAFESPLIAISTSSINALSHWATAGWISQKIYTGITISGVGDAVVERQRVLLNRLSLFDFPLNFASTYQLTFDFPSWIADLSISIWEYQGKVDDFSDKLQRIEQKIDDIATFGGFGN